MAKKRYSISSLYFEKLKKDYFLANDFGGFIFASPIEFDGISTGRIKPGTAFFLKMARAGFVKELLDFETLAEQMRNMKEHVYKGPSLHIIVLTLKCNHFCSYCRAIANRENTANNMSWETAKKTLDFVFSTPNPDICVEFQGGEALLNWEVLKSAVEYAGHKNRKFKKNLALSVVTNLSLMDGFKLGFLMKNKVSVCTSLDGPRELHDANRIYFAGSSYNVTVNWLKKILKEAEETKKRRRDCLPSALMTTTKKSLKYARKIIDEYANIGLGGIFLRPLSPIGYAKSAWDRIGYSPHEYLEFYGEALDCVLAVNRRGKRFIERSAAIFLKKLLKKEDPNFLDLRSPCGAAIGQLAYNYDGKIYACDEGRMTGACGDDFFRLGRLGADGYREILNSGVSKMCLMASCLENQVSCSRCAFKPFCGVCPVHNYETQKSPWGSMASSSWCALQKGIYKIILEKLKNAGNRAIFESWITAG
ncbi:MAG: His-Xaa-Ser system radical SAM maturase HxsB [Elusimicrobia bacterium]|nr:His-Xaa-Ser system radical SAM maturase HxsB [Elusimicrobiota bacterium]